MRSATALKVPVRPHPWKPTFDQAPLPFPELTPVVPAPVERDPLAGHTILREKAGHFMQALVEVLAGDRPARQLAASMSPDVYNQLIARLSVRGRSTQRFDTRRRARVVSVHVSMVDLEHAELAGRFLHCGRSRAIAVRLELHRDHRGVARWLCSAVVWA